MAIPENVQRYLDKAGEHRWRFNANGNDKILADSGEGYKEAADMEHALSLLWPDAEAVAAALAILTLITGEDWDRQKLLDHQDHIKAVAVQTLRRQGLTDADASTFVEDRFKTYAADLPQESPPSAIAANAATEAPKFEHVVGEAGTIPDRNELKARLAARREAAKSPDPVEDPGSEPGTTSP